MQQNEKIIDTGKKKWQNKSTIFPHNVPMAQVHVHV